MRIIIKRSKERSVFLIRYIFFAIFTVNTLGAFYFWKEENSPILVTVLIGVLAFLFGLILGSVRLPGLKLVTKSTFRKHTIEELESNPRLRRQTAKVLMIIFVISCVFSLSLFLEKGIPLFATNNNLARSTFGVGTWGRIRMLVTWCPMCAMCLFALEVIDKKYKKKTILAILISLVFLMFYSFKGNILWFIVMLYFVNTFMKSKIEFGKGLIYAGMAAIMMLVVFSLWLSVDYAVAFDYLLKRVTQDEVDGLNFIITQYVPTTGLGYGEHFVYEFETTMLSVYKESFDILLASLFYGKKVSWGIVQTFYGFLYLDFGNVGVFVGYLILGIIVRKLEISLEDIKKNTLLGVCLKIYFVYVLIKIILVGNLFNELKGLGLSAVIFVVVYYIVMHFLVVGDGLETIKASNDNGT